MTEEAKAANVVEALSRVMRDLPAIGKDQKAAEAQGGYAYRGIEQITKEAQGLCAEHGVVFTPRVVGVPVVVDLTVNGKPWTDTRMLVEYDVRGPGGPDDRIVVGPIFALGRDNSDKGANKCMTQAFKYALLQTFMVADSKDDADGSTHEADSARAPLPPITPDLADALRARMEALPPEQLDALKAEWVAAGFVKVENLPVDRLDAASALVARFEAGGTWQPAETTEPSEDAQGPDTGTPERPPDPVLTVTPEQIEERAQAGVCVGCGEPFTKTGKHKQDAGDPLYGGSCAPF